MDHHPCNRAVIRAISDTNANVPAGSDPASLASAASIDASTTPSSPSKPGCDAEPEPDR
jgi:hypothetical protein